MVFEFLRAPGSVFRQLTQTDARARQLGIRAVVLMGVCWALFLAYLAVSGHSPSGKLLLPIAPEEYYGWEAVFIIPLQLLMLLALSVVAHKTAAGLGGSGSLEATVLVAGLSMCVPSLFLWLLPDGVVTVLAGFDSMAGAMRFYVPLSILYTILLMTSGLRAVHELPTGRAFLAAALGLLVHWLIAGPVVR